MHGHEAELLTTTLLMLSAIGCGLILKFFRQPIFLLAVIAASLFVLPIWSNVLHYLVVRSKIHRLGEPTKLSNAPS